MFSLAVSPCCDEIQATKSSHNQKIASFDEHEHDSHDHNVCSPFCTCSSCGCHGYYIDFVRTAEIESTIEQSITEKNSQYAFQFVSQFESNIWQPPQLV